MEGRWGPWVKTSKELGLIGPKSQNDKKAYNKYIKAGFQKLPIFWNYDRQQTQKNFNPKFFFQNFFCLVSFECSNIQATTTIKIHVVSIVM